MAKRKDPKTNPPPEPDPPADDCWYCGKPQTTACINVCYDKPHGKLVPMHTVNIHLYCFAEDETPRRFGLSLLQPDG